MKATNHVYVSDLFTVPMPKHAASPEEFRRKVLIRRLVWAALPYVLEGCLFDIDEKTGKTRSCTRIRR